MTLKEVAQKVASAAPLLGKVLAGPAGGAAGTLIASLFGCEDTPDAIDAAISLDPDAMLKIRELEYSHAAKLGQLALDEESARLGDVQSARQREIELTRTTGKVEYTLYALAWTVVVGFFLLTGVLMAVPLKEGSSEVVFLLFGGLVSGFTQVLGYFFGSSKSSAEKTRLLKPGQ